ncbi:MAG: hypothetical protein ACO3A4_00120 [Silvanigrellaceae bacterium]
MLRRIVASLSMACAVLSVSNAKANDSQNEAFLPNAFELAYMGYQGQFLDWGLPSAGLFCSDVNNRMLIAQDVAYAYLLHSGYIDSLLRPAEGKMADQGQTQTQGQAQVKGKDIPVSQGQTQTQGQAQAKAKDIPVMQGQAQSKSSKLLPGQSQAGSQSGLQFSDINVRRFVDYSNALTDDEVRLVRENFDREFLDDLYGHMRSLCRD